MLDSVSLIDLTRGDLLAAGTHAPLRSNDAIHLAVALRVGAAAIVTYDGELDELFKLERLDSGCGSSRSVLALTAR